MLFQRFINVCLFAVLSLSAASARAGILLSLGPNWNNFVFEPLEKEETPNYYGYGARASFGYSIQRVWDLALYGHYSPGKISVASALKEDARFYHMGAETGLRIAKAVYIGVRGGPALYRLLKQNEDSEIPGQWTGYNIQGSLGLILPTSKAAGWQTSLDLGQATLRPSDDSSAKPRTLSQVSLTLAFVYNGYQTSSVDTAILNNWIKNLGN